MAAAQTVRVGVIGRGFGGRSAAAAYEQTEGCELVDVITPRDEAALTALCEREDLDLVSVHAPPFLHGAVVRRAVAARPGRAVLCEKPFGRNAEEAGELCRLAEETGMVNLVNYEFRIHPVRSRLRELVLDGAVGPVEHVEWIGYTSVWGPARPYRWVFDAALGGGWVRASACHHIDFLRWTFGEIVEASAVLRTVVPERADADGVPRTCTAEDGFSAVLRTDQGTTIVLDTTATAAVDLPMRATVIGRDGVLEVLSESAHEVGGRILLHTPEGTSEPFRADAWADTNAHDELAMVRWTTKIRDAVRGAADPMMPTFADGLACGRVMDLLTRPAVHA